MAKNVRENTYKRKDDSGRLSQNEFMQIISLLLKNKNVRFTLGLFFLLLAMAMFGAFTSYFLGGTGKPDQSLVESFWNNKLTQSGAEVQNWLGLTGAILAHMFVFKGFGIAAYILVIIAFVLGWRFLNNVTLIKLSRLTRVSIFFLIWISTLVALADRSTFVSGAWGFELANYFLVPLFGSFFSVVITFAILAWFVVKTFAYDDYKKYVSTNNGIVKTISDAAKSVRYERVEKSKKMAETAKVGEEEDHKDTFSEEGIILEVTDDEPALDKTKPIERVTKITEDPAAAIKKERASKLRTTRMPKVDTEDVSSEDNEEIIPDMPPFKSPISETPLEMPKEVSPKRTRRSTEKLSKRKPSKLDLELTDESAPVTPQPPPSIDKVTEKVNPFFEKAIQKDINFKEEAESNREVKEEKKLEAYDPTLDLSTYKFPTADLLNDMPEMKRQVSNEELEANKDRIVETLSNYGIGISQIKATIGPTVTLYEIIPEAGVRISKIKNLEDDIALSLAALGIRIIAPIPGKGTIGIEVPNKKREVVTMRSIMEDDAFKNTKASLPIVLGKTIENKVFLADLAKMPHVLMAGATGQGKSVGLNVFLATLIYKKHPAELKFVLIDPKKVELTLFNAIEKHFLATLPDSEEAIITDNQKVIHTLNSLCLEMDNRYNLLKDALCRNIKEYNQKFTQRKLNPKKGHKFMPYIVLVIDELADLMMTAGKEVEQPIARLAQLARAIGIHLVVATQRPSVNVITGVIKANFPARLSFKVTSKIDSRTILDAGGAEQLVGMGDMLFSMGAEMVRLQGAFLDTPEVERVCNFIGNQQGYPEAYQLPEFHGEDSKGGGSSGGSVGDRDELFDEAARIIVMHQQGSTSLLQRRLKLGYNRAGRLIDQLEQAGIVGPFEGSKAREVLIPDEYSLERLLNEISNNG